MIPTESIETQNSTVDIVQPSSHSVLYRKQDVLPKSYIQTALTVLSQIWDNIVSHRMRSILTSVGIIIGIGSIYTILVLGDTGKAYTRSLLMPYHIGTIVIQTNSASTPMNQPQIGDFGTNRTSMISLDNFFFFKNACAGTAAISPVSDVITFNIKCDGYNVRSPRILAVTSDYKDIAKLTIVSGRYLMPTDIQTAVVSVDQSGRFQGLSFPILGRVMIINNIPYKVVGTVKKDVGINRAPDIMVSFAPQIHKQITRILMYGKVNNAETELNRTRALARSRQVSNLSAHLAEDDEAGSMSVFLSFVNLLSLVSAISLAVGCIGVMNTLIASVQEKTFEVGVRSAIGASPFLIFSHFLGEAVLLCAAAGIIGVLTGAFAVTLISTMNNMSPVFNPGPIALSLCAATLVGIAGGTLPACQAARLSPYDALRKGSS